MLYIGMRLLKAKLDFERERSMNSAAPSRSREGLDVELAGARRRLASASEPSPKSVSRRAAIARKVERSARVMTAGTTASRSWPWNRKRFIVAFTAYQPSSVGHGPDRTGACRNRRTPLARAPVGVSRARSAQRTLARRWDLTAGRMTSPKIRRAGARRRPKPAARRAVAPTDCLSALQDRACRSAARRLAPPIWPRSGPARRRRR